MAYTPDAYDDTQPVASVAASTLPLELRTLKSALIGRKTASETNANNIQTNADAIAALAAAVAAGTRFQWLTSTTEDTFTTPAGVTSLLVIAVGGGQGGQGGGQRVRFRPVWSNSLTGPYSAYYGLGARAANGKAGRVVVQEVAVTEGEDLNYICGAGSTGGAAVSTVNVSASSPVIDRFCAEPGNNLNNDWYIYDVQNCVAGMSLRDVTEVDGVVTSKTFDAVLTGECRHVGAAGGNTRYRTRAYSSFVRNTTLNYGDIAGVAGDTRFGIPVNPNDPALLEVAGGGSDSSILTASDVAALFGSNFGAAGVGGACANAGNATPTAGTDGNQGAILVMW